MNRSECKSVAEVCASHIVAQLVPLLNREINPSKVRCGVKALADYLHRTCGEISRSGASAECERYFLPLLDAHAMLCQALCAKPLNREHATRAYAMLLAVKNGIKSN